MESISTFEAEKPKRKSILVQTLTRGVKLLFNKAFYVMFSLILQILWWGLLFVVLASYSPYISVAAAAASILAVLTIVNKYMNPSYKLAWSITILAIPVFGLTLYVLLGKSRVQAKMEKRFDTLDREGKDYLKESSEVCRALKNEDISAYHQSQYISSHAFYPAYQGTAAEYFQIGDDMFPVLVSELEKAQKYIFIEYFIINDGIMWRTILEILEKKASEGVDVRLIYDGFGCLSTLPVGYFKKLEKMGIKCGVFNPFRPILNVVFNNRDHRKICVIDGWTGFTGGINLADEYINRKKRFGRWKDTAVMLKGDAVRNMTVMFLRMWNVVKNEETPVDYENYTPVNTGYGKSSPSGFVQPFGDSPLDNESVAENIYLNIINRAKRYVYICSPYLIIDNEMITALTLAAKSGVDVRIMTPGIPDKKLTFLLTQSYYEQLLQAGVKIYAYQPGFLHAKSFVCDDEIAVVGTINLDYRSLYLHFEDGVWMYKNTVIEEIKKDFTENLDECDRCLWNSAEAENGRSG